MPIILFVLKKRVPGSMATQKIEGIAEIEKKSFVKLYWVEDHEDIREAYYYTSRSGHTYYHVLAHKQKKQPFMGPYKIISEFIVIYSPGRRVFKNYFSSLEKYEEWQEKLVKVIQEAIPEFVQGLIDNGEFDIKKDDFLFILTENSLTVVWARLYDIVLEAEKEFNQENLEIYEVKNPEQLYNLFFKSSHLSDTQELKISQHEIKFEKPVKAIILSKRSSRRRIIESTLIYVPFDVNVEVVHPEHGTDKFTLVSNKFYLFIHVHEIPCKA